MGLFGGSKRTPSSAAPASTSTTKAHATNQASHQGKAVDEILSPKSGSASLALPQVHEALRRTPSPLPFDLHAAIATLEGEDGTREGQGIETTVETLNATAAHLGNLLAVNDDIFSNTVRDLPGSVGLEDIRTLYIRGVALATTKRETVMRTAAIRLLAALIATYPPAYFQTDEEVALPDVINIVSLYKLITSTDTHSIATPDQAHVEAIFVQVGALKALTKNGSQVVGLDGIVGWLINALNSLIGDFGVWCTKKDDWEIKVSSCAFASA
jgi:hypothetical protein